MKKVLAGILAVTLTVSAVPLPDFAGGAIGSSLITASAASAQVYDGDLDLNGKTLEVNGDMYMTKGKLNIGTGKLIVHGSLYLQTESGTNARSYIVMQQSSGSITVDKDLIVRMDPTMVVSETGKTTTNGLITAGTITVGGSVKDLNTNSSTGSNCLIMTGTSTLNMTMESAGDHVLQLAYFSRLNNFKCASTSTNRLKTGVSQYFYAAKLQSNVYFDPTYTLHVSSDLNGKTLDINGSVIQDYGVATGFSNDVNINGGTMNVSGDYTVNAGYTVIGGGKLNVTGSYKVSNGAKGLTMTNAKDAMIVGGDFVLSSTGGTSELKSGTLTVKGSYDSSKAKLEYSDPHKTILDGSKYQDVAVPTGKKIPTLQIMQDISQYPSDIQSKAVVLLDKNGNKITSGTTPTVTSIAGATITLGTTSYTYDGAEKKPAVSSVKLGTKTLIANTDYTVSYSNNTNAGTATVTVTGKGSYTGTATKNFTINPKGLTSSTATITLTPASYTYDGTAKTPETTVVVGSKTLTKGTDYTVAYSNNTAAGSGKATLTFKGNYSGSVSKTFTISKKSISGVSVTLPSTSYTYTGSAIKPEPTVKDGSKTLVKGTDYTVTYSNNTNAGTATVKITGAGNYTGTQSATFTITQAAASAVDLSKCTVTLGTTSYTYDGTEKKPSVTVKNGTTSLTSGTDYTVSYSNNINAGTATVTVTAKGAKYTGSVSKTFTINPKGLTSSTATITLTPASYTYDGTAKTPETTVVVGSKTLTKGTDYTVAYSNNTAAGSGKATLTFKGNYSGSVSKTFTISKKSISDASVTLPSNSYVYTGSTIKPEPTVKDGGKTLVKGTDYTVAYSANIKVGTATVTVTGTGNYTGTAKATFTIGGSSISNAEVSVIGGPYIYNGSAKKPAASNVVVMLGGSRLSSTNDFTFEVTDNVNAGTATVTVTGKGSYTGTAKGTFTIAPASISGAGVTVTSTHTADGKTKHIPTVTVTVGGKTLKQGTDYTVDAENNINAGTATAVITGKGNYTGICYKDFTIKAAAVSMKDCTVKLSQDTYEYNGKARRPQVVVKNGDKELSSTNYSVSYANNINAGTATVTVTGKGGYSGSVTLEYTIEPSDITTAALKLEKNSYDYDGAEKRPAVTLTKDGRTLVEGVDYDITYSNNKDIGTAYVSINGKGNYIGSVGQQFMINSPNAKSISGFNVRVEPDTFVYDGTDKVPERIILTDGNVTLTEWVDFETSYNGNVNAGTATILIMGKGNYKGTLTVDFTILPASLDGASAELETTSYEYDGDAKTPVVSVTVGGKKLEDGKDYTVGYTGNVNAGTAKAVITGMGNYEGSLESSFTISPRDAANLQVRLDSTEFEYEGKAVTPAVTVSDNGRTLAAGADYDVRYEDNDKPGTASVIISFKGNYSGEISRSFTIKEKYTEEPAPMPEPDHVTDPEHKDITLGDVNLDGKIDVTDVTKLAAYIKGFATLTGDSLIAADADHSGEVNVQDLTLIAAYVKGFGTLE